MWPLFAPVSANSALAALHIQFAVPSSRFQPNYPPREERRVAPRTLFSIEPGIYLPGFGVRSETNVYIAADRTVHVMGGELQRQVLVILSA